MTYRKLWLQYNKKKHISAALSISEDNFLRRTINKIWKFFAEIPNILMGNFVIILIRKVHNQSLEVIFVFIFA